MGQGERGWQNISMNRHKGTLGGSWGMTKRTTDRWVEANSRESQSQTRSGEPWEVLEQGRDKLRKPGWAAARSPTGFRMLARCTATARGWFSSLAQLALADQWDSVPRDKFCKMALPTDLGSGSCCSHPPSTPTPSLSLFPLCFSSLTQVNGLPVGESLSR